MTEWLASLGVELNIIPHLVALLIAYVLALPIGWDRERNERSAGLRTFPLVAIASCGFIQAAETITLGNAEATARVVEGLINGVGFIGGGAILVGKVGTRGTATAASIWATGAIGVAVGLGSYDTAIVVSIVTFATLKWVTNFKSEKNQSLTSKSDLQQPCGRSGATLENSLKSFAARSEDMEPLLHEAVSFFVASGLLRTATKVGRCSHPRCCSRAPPLYWRLCHGLNIISRGSYDKHQGERLRHYGSASRASGRT